MALIGRASDGTGDEIVVCACENGSELARWRVPGVWVRRAVFWPEGDQLVTVDDSETVRFWAKADGRPLRRVVVHRPLPNARDFIAPLAISPDGSRLVTGGLDGSVKLWALADNRLVARLPPHARLVTDAAFSPDGRLLATADSGEVIRLWNLDLEREAGSLDLDASAEPRSNDGIRCLGFTPRGEALVGLNRRGLLKTWRTDRARPLRPGGHAVD